MNILNLLWRLIKDVSIIAACGIALVLWYAFWFCISLVMGVVLSLPLPWTKILLWIAPHDLRKKMLDEMQAELDKQEKHDKPALEL